jgi:signal peptidase II
MLPKLNNRTLAISIAAAIYIFDQLTKYWVTGPLGLAYEGATYDIISFFQFTLTHNEGIALGLFPADSGTERWILTGILACITAGVGYWMFTEKVRGDAIGLAMVLGGALGNLTDRARFGYVIDFADLHFGDFRPFLIFNIADAAITVGVLILLARALLVREPEPKVES